MEHGTHLYALWKRQRALRLRLLVVLLASAGLFLWLRPHLFPPAATVTPTPGAPTAPAQSSGTLTKGTPDYATITPSGKTVEWIRVSPPSHNAVFAFTDTVGGVAITVSEQPLPDDFKSNTDTKLEELAKNYNATRFITVDTAKVYIGTSGKGPQSLILTKNSVLILVKSAAVISDDQWTTYLKTLRQN